VRIVRTVGPVPDVDALTATYAQLRHAVEIDVERAVERMAAFLMTNRRFPPAMKWFSRAVGFSPSMSDTPPELLATVGVAYHQLGERFIAARMFDKTIEEAGDNGHTIIGNCFAAGDPTTVNQRFSTSGVSIPHFPPTAKIVVRAC
jgi:hypothetical protein